MANTTDDRRRTGMQRRKPTRDTFAGEVIGAQADKPKCWACEGVLSAGIGVANQYGPGKIHIGCRRSAERKARAIRVEELERRYAGADGYGELGYISRNPRQLSAEDWEARGEAEDNSPAIQPKGW